MIITATNSINLKLIRGNILIFVPKDKEALAWLEYVGLLEIAFDDESIALDALMYWVSYIRKEFNIGFIP
jgi:hypothetical protein